MVCVICNKSLGNEIVVVRKKGLATLIKFSHLRSDGLFKIFGSVEDIILHTKCRKKYIKEISKRQQKLLESKAIAAEDTAGPSSDSETEFTFEDFKEKCFICAQELTDDLIYKGTRTSSGKRRLCYHITSETTKQTLIAALRKNQESVRSQKILQRIENVQLECVQARYHKDCYSSVMFPKRNQKKGRPECNYVASAMQIIFDFIEQSKESQFSLNELKNILTDYVPEERTIIKKLYEKFGNNFYITNSPGESSIITFKASLDDIIIDNWYLQKDKNRIHEDNWRIVKKAAEIIREDIILTKAYDKTSANAKEDVPQSLELYLKTLAGPRTTTETVEKRLLSIAHKIIHVVRPKNK